MCPQGTIEIADRAEVRAWAARHFRSDIAPHHAQSAVFRLKLRLIAAFDTTYKPIFADKKVAQAAQMKSVSHKRLPPYRKGWDWVNETVERR
jgi:hypothetical protein